MAQRVYLIVLDTDEEEPEWDSFEDNVQQSVLSVWNNIGLSEMDFVEPVNGCVVLNPFYDFYDMDQIADMVANLQEKIRKDKSEDDGEA